MNHSEEALLSAFLDGELESSERIRMKEHLISCLDCQEELASLRTVKTILARAPRKSAPAGWAANWPKTPIGRESSWGENLRLPMPSKAWVPASVAAALALAIGLWIMGSHWIFPRTASSSELSLNSSRPAQDISRESATRLVAPPITGSVNHPQTGTP